MQSVQVMRQVEKKAKLGRQVSLERKDVLTAVWGGSVINLKLALCLQAVKVGHSPVSVQQKELCSNLSSKLYLLFELIQTFSQIMSRLSFWCFLDLFIISSKLTFGLSFTSDKGQCKGQTSRRTLCVLDGFIARINTSPSCHLFFKK